MYESFSEFFSALTSGEFTFARVGEFFSGVVQAIGASEGFVSVWAAITSFFAPIASIAPFILMGLCVLLMLFGQRTLAVTRFLAFFVAGYCVGVCYVQPLLASSLTVPAFVPGAVVAVVVAVLAKYLYYLFFAVSAGFSVYLLLVCGMIGILAPFTAGNPFVSLIGGIAAAVIALLIRKYVEMLGTAFLGAYLLYLLFLANVYDYSTLEVFGGNAALPMLITTGVLALIGFAVQVRIRKRY